MDLCFVKEAGFLRVSGATANETLRCKSLIPWSLQGLQGFAGFILGRRENAVVMTTENVIEKYII
jgi:hypothetical protein